MKYAWVSLAVLAIWISAILMLVSEKITNPEAFFFYIMVTTIVLTYIGFKPASV